MVRVEKQWIASKEQATHAITRTKPPDQQRQILNSSIEKLNAQLEEQEIEWKQQVEEHEALLLDRKRRLAKLQDDLALLDQRQGEGEKPTAVSALEKVLQGLMECQKEGIAASLGLNHEDCQSLQATFSARLKAYQLKINFADGAHGETAKPAAAPSPHELAVAVKVAADKKAAELKEEMARQQQVLEFKAQADSRAA